MRSWYVLTCKRGAIRRGWGGKGGGHCGYTLQAWPSRVHSKAELRSMHIRSEQNCSKIRHTGCNIYICRSAL